jgi:hypothetical protein
MGIYWATIDIFYGIDFAYIWSIIKYKANYKAIVEAGCSRKLGHIPICLWLLIAGVNACR